VVDLLILPVSTYTPPRTGIFVTGQAIDQITLLGDIGATNARFAMLTAGVLGPVKWIDVARHSQFADAIEEFLQSQFFQSQFFQSPVWCAVLAVAGPVEGQRSYLTNSSWTIDGCEIRNRFAFRAVRLVNDFEATALSLPHLLEQDVRTLGGGQAVSNAPMVVLGPGSGLGVAALVGDGARQIVIASEGGHATFPAASAREDAVLVHLRKRFGHVSAERVLSGPGIENLYYAIAALDGIDVKSRNAADITNAALQGSCLTSRAALDMFCAMLGGFAGNVALTYGARGGVYIAGGIAPRILDYLADSEFRLRFEQKGRFCAYLESIPSKVIVHSTATFLGLKSLATSRPPEAD
jgi:glucokinase